MRVPAGSKGCSASALAFQEGEIPMQTTAVTCRQGACRYLHGTPGHGLHEICELKMVVLDLQGSIFPGLCDMKSPYSSIYRAGSLGLSLLLQHL